MKPFEKHTPHAYTTQEMEGLGIYMKTIVTTQIEDDGYLAKTPHNADLTGSGDTESRAINDLIASIRSHGDNPLAWDSNAKPPKSKETIVRHLSGCWPLNPQQPKPAAKSAAQTEQNNG